MNYEKLIVSNYRARIKQRNMFIFLLFFTHTLIERYFILIIAYIFCVVIEILRIYFRYFITLNTIGKIFLIISNKFKQKSNYLIKVNFRKIYGNVYGL